MEFMEGIENHRLDAFVDIEFWISRTRECLSYLEFNQLQGGFLVEQFRKVREVAWVWKNFVFGRVFSDEDAGQRFREEFEARTEPAFRQLICVLKDGEELLKSCIVKDRRQDWLQKAMKRADCRALFEGIVKGLSWCMPVVYEEILGVLERGNVDVSMCQMHRWDVVLEDSLVRLGVEAQQDEKNLVERLDLLLLQELDPGADDHNPSPQSLKRQQDHYIAKYVVSKLTDPNRPLLQDRESSSTGRRSGAGAEGSVHGAEEKQGSNDQEGSSAGKRGINRVRTLPQYFWVDDSALASRDRPRLAQGASGVVYKIQWLREQYVVKMITSDYKTFTLETFKTEAFILAHLRHPHILQLISCSRSKDNDKFYLVMESMKQDLQQLIDNCCRKASDGTRSPPFSLHVAVDIMLQIARAMEYLHQKGVMHRDLKSLNVLIESYDQREGRVRIKVADFGLSKVITDSSSLSSFVGTTYWRAPEVFQQEPHKYKLSADVYSFAITSYEILTGLVPFLDLNADELYDRIRNGGRPPIPHKIPIYLSSCLQRWWAGTPSDRPTFPEIRRMLQHLQRVLLRVPTQQVENFLRGKPEAHNFSIFSSFTQEDVEELISIMGHAWCKDMAVGPDKISHHLFEAAAASWLQGHSDSHQQDLASSILRSTVTHE